mgnify:CR=1 FL=1
MARKFSDAGIPAESLSAETLDSDRHQIQARLRDRQVNFLFVVDLYNEGVDIPSANVAIVISGSGSVREHVQRLGRILRKQGDKRALLYELVTADTSEAFTSDRRREHVAYR